MTATCDGGLHALQSAQSACTRCADAGLLARANPVFSGRAGQRVLLVGQAPGVVEDGAGRPFAGRAGRQLMRWLVRAGFAGESDVRRRVHMTSVTACYPGRAPGGAGDRRPTPAEIALCSPWLEARVALVRPRLVLLVGSLAASRFLPPQGLDRLVGRALTVRGADAGEPPEWPVLVVMPHPSGQSRWLNDAANAARLEAALGHVRRLLPLAEAGIAKPASRRCYDPPLLSVRAQRSSLVRG